MRLPSPFFLSPLLSLFSPLLGGTLGHGCELSKKAGRLGEAGRQWKMKLVRHMPTEEEDGGRQGQTDSSSSSCNFLLLLPVLHSYYLPFCVADI